MSLKYRAPKECSPVVVKAKLECESWLTPEVDAAWVAASWESNTTFTIVATDEFNRGCCYDTSLIGKQSELETAQFDGFGLTYKQKWPIISAATNFFVIQSMGALYEGVADWLTDKENYRTQTEFNDALIIKNFLFQFVNNYFVLFYIAYLRQIEFQGSKKECNQSCLGELQLQMMIVFTGKTFGLQLVELLKPFVAGRIDLALEMRRSKKAVQKIQQAELLHETDESSLADHARTSAQRTDEYHETRSANVTEESMAGMDEYERQTHMVNYEKKGTFDDFNEMAIQ